MTNTPSTDPLQPADAPVPAKIIRAKPERPAPTLPMPAVVSDAASANGIAQRTNGTAHRLNGARRPAHGAGPPSNGASGPRIAKPDTEPQGADGVGLTIVARRGTLNIVGAAVNGLLSFVLVVIVTRMLLAAGAGVFFEATSIFMLAGTVAIFGSDTALVRFISQDLALGFPERIRRHILVGTVPSAITGLVTGGLLFWLAPEVASHFVLSSSLQHNPELVTMIRVLAPFLPVYVTYLNGLAATRGFGSMVPTNIIDRLAVSALQPAAVFVVAAMALGSGIVITAWAMPMLIGLVPIAFWLRRLGRRTGVNLGPNGYPDAVAGTAGRDFWRFSTSRGVASIFQIGQDRVGILLVGALSTASGAGVFAAAARWLIAGSFFSDALNQGMQPTMSGHLARRDYVRAGRLYQVSTGWTMLISGPMYIAMAIFPATLLRPFGHSFHGGALTLTVLALAAFAGAATGSVTTILLMGGKSSWNLINTSAALGADLVLGILLIPHLGLIGAAISTDTGLLIANVLPVVQVFRLYRIHPFGPELWVSLAASVGCFVPVGLAIRFLLGQSLSAALLFAALSCPAYLLAAWRKRDALQLTALSSIVPARIRRLVAGSGRHQRGAATGLL
jgi:O-antigen/teichoic acid export membrane protein